LACAYIDAPHQAIPPMLHATTLDAIHRRICVLPVRFGVVLRDEAEIHSLLHDRRHELLDHLSRLDWTCEMGVILEGGERKAEGGKEGFEAMGQGTRDQASGVRGFTSSFLPHSSSFPQSPNPEIPKSLSYIEHRRAFYQRTDEDAEQDRWMVRQFVERLHGYYRQWRKLPASPSHRIRLAFLVERDRVTAFQSRVENARKACQEGRYVVLGPWPPYSFVEALSECLHTNIGSLERIQPMQSAQQ
jgi:hypothetical protein